MYFTSVKSFGANCSVKIEHHSRQTNMSFLLSDFERRPKFWATSSCELFSFFSKRSFFQTHFRTIVGETLDFEDGEAQLWSKRLVDGSFALLFVNLGRMMVNQSFKLEDIGLNFSTTTDLVDVRNVWSQRSNGKISRDGNITFTAVAGHDSRFVVLTPLRHSSINIAA